jgi:hypothetical protein
VDHPTDSNERNGGNFVVGNLNFNKEKEIVYKRLRVTIIAKLNKQLKGRNMKGEEKKCPNFKILRDNNFRR